MISANQSTTSTTNQQVKLDPAQYLADLGGGSDCYDASMLNILVRRKGKENNFKAVLETIRDLMSQAQSGTAVPHWLHDVFLGYGDPAAAHYKTLQAKAAAEAAAAEDDDEAAAEAADGVMDFRDSFLDAQHVVDAFPAAKVVFTGAGSSSSSSPPPPPYRLRFRDGDGGDGGGSGSVVEVEAYAAPPAGPYPADQPKRNAVRFTPAQAEAVRSGMSKGLTLVVGPPGTGKTDVAVQIIANLYHNHPTAKTLIVTHSNAALNDLFAKIMVGSGSARACGIVISTVVMVVVAVVVVVVIVVVVVVVVVVVTTMTTMVIEDRC